MSFVMVVLFIVGLTRTHILLFPTFTSVPKLTFAYADDKHSLSINGIAKLVVIILIVNMTEKLSIARGSG